MSRVHRILAAAAVLAGTIGLTLVARPMPAGAVGTAAGKSGVLGSDTPASFWLASAAGNIWSFGSVGFYGSPGVLQLAKPIVDMVPTSGGHGYWSVGADGGVFSYGDAGFFGSAGGLHVVAPVVGLAPTPDGGGYWLVASDGGVFAFGDAGFFGSMGGHRLAQPVVGMAPTPDGGGYWIVASDGGVFAFGDAGFFGSTGAVPLAEPVVAVTPTRDGRGYWLLASDGGVFAFGDAGFFGSDSGATTEPAEHLVTTRSGAGYWVVDQNGTAATFGDARGAPPVQALVFSPVTPGDKAVLFAFFQLGKPYIWGGNGPVGYDCSGLALASWQHGAGISFARVADDQYHSAGVPVPMGSLQAGDLVFWATDPADWTTVDHTAMYVGGGMIVEATGDHVQLNTLGQWGSGRLVPGARRP